MSPKRSIAEKTGEVADMAKIVTVVPLDFKMRAKVESDIKDALSDLGVPIADTRGQIHLLLKNTDKEVSELRIPVEYLKKVRDALTDKLETRGLKAEVNRAGNEIKIQMAPQEDQRKAIGY